MFIVTGDRSCKCNEVSWSHDDNHWSISGSDIKMPMWATTVQSHHGLLQSHCSGRVHTSHPLNLVLFYLSKWAGMRIIFWLIRTLFQLVVLPTLLARPDHGYQPKCRTVYKTQYKGGVIVTILSSDWPKSMKVPIKSPWLLRIYQWCPGTTDGVWNLLQAALFCDLQRPLSHRLCARLQAGLQRQMLHGLPERLWENLQARLALVNPIELFIIP